MRFRKRTTQTIVKYRLRFAPSNLPLLQRFVQGDQKITLKVQTSVGVKYLEQGDVTSLKLRRT